jgi:hypothetical protein
VPPVRSRVVLSWLLLGGLAACAFEPLYLKVFRASARSQLRATLSSLAEEPGYGEFLREVEARTEPGSTIVILAPRPWGEGGYEYVYYRAVYLVEGRRILPAIWTNNEPAFGNVREARYIAAWSMPVTSPSHELVWAGPKGGLYRKREAPR